MRVMDLMRQLFKDFRTPLYRNAMFLMANTVANNVFGFVFWMIVAWFYAASDFGLATALIAAALLVANLSTLGLDIGLIRFLPEARGRETSMINSTFTITGGLAVIIATVFLLGIDIWSPALGFLVDNIYFVIVFVSTAAFFSLTLVMNNVFIAKRAVKYMFLRNVVYGVVRIGFPAFFALMAVGVLGIFASWGVAALIALLIGWLVFIRKLIPDYWPRFTASRTVVNDMFHFSFGNYIAGLFAMLPALVLPMMLLNLASAELAAYFYVAWMIAGILYVVPRAIATSLYAEGSHFQEHFVRDLKKSLKLMFGLVVLGIAVVFFFGNYLLLLFSSSFSENAFGLLRVLALSAVFVSLNAVYFTIKRVEKKVMPIIVVCAFTAVGTLGITYVLLPSLGLLSVGVGWLISQGLASGAIGLTYVLDFLRSQKRKARAHIP